MESYSNDINIKFEHTPVTNKFAFKLNDIGAHAGDSIEVTTLSHTDSNTIYVNGSTGNDSNDGTSASPKLTILASINATTATKIYVLVMNSQHFAEDLSTATTTFLTGLFANTAITATLSTRILGYTPADANSIYFGATSGTGGGDGTSGDPTNTIALAVGLTDGSHQKIIEVDGDTYTEPAIEMTANFLGMYAADGVKPTFKPQASHDNSDYTVAFETVSQTQYESGDSLATDSVTLLNGKAVCIYRDGGDSDKGKFCMVDTDGSLDIQAKVFSDSGSIRHGVGALTNGGFVICFEDSADLKGKFIIYNSVGTEVVSETEFEAGETRAISCTGLANGNWVVSFSDHGDSARGKFIIYDSGGSSVAGPTTFESNATEDTYTELLSNDEFIIVYNDASTDDGVFTVYDEDGNSSVASTTFTTNHIGGPSVAGLDTGNWVCCYADTTNSGRGTYTIRQNDGTNVVSPTVYETGTTTLASVNQLQNGSWSCVYADWGDSQRLKYVVYEADGSLVISPTILINSTTDSETSVITGLGNLLYFYDISNSGYYAEEYLYSWSGVKVSAASNINGWIFDGQDSNQLDKLIEPNGFKPDIKWCDIKETTNPSTATIAGYGISGDNETDVSNCKIYDNDGGIYLTTNDTIIQDSQFYRNAATYAIHIDGAASSSGDITIEHNDIFQNYAGLRFENNNGSNELIKNNIIHNNDNYAIEADVSVSHSNSVRTDPLETATDGSSIILANPLYINEGATDPTAIDLNIKTKVEGFPSDSPAKDLADDTRNAGSHDVRYIGAQTTWTSITVAKPRRGVIDLWYEAVGGQKSVGQDGTVEYSKKGQTENVKIKWVGLLDAEFNLVRAMWMSSESEVRIYFQPTTSPDTYNTYTMTRKNLPFGVRQYELSRTGVDATEIDFARKYEEA